MKYRIISIIILLVVNTIGIYNYFTSVSEDTISYINNILGITQDTEYYVSNLELIYIFLEFDDTVYLNKLDENTSIQIIYDYAMHNELLDTDNTTTFSISSDNLNSIIQKYNLNEEYDYTNLTHSSIYTVDYTKISHDLTYKKKSKNIIVSDNLTLEDLDGNTIYKTIKYTFKYDDNNYYLYSFVVE